MSLANVIGTILYKKSHQDFLGQLIEVDGRQVAAITTAFSEPQVFEGAVAFVTFSAKAVEEHKNYLQNYYFEKDRKYVKGRWRDIPVPLHSADAEENLAQLLFQRVSKICPVKMQTFKTGSRNGTVKFWLQNEQDVAAIRGCIATIQTPSFVTRGEFQVEAKAPCRVGFPLDENAIVFLKTQKSEIDFSRRGEIVPFKDRDSNISGRVYVDGSDRAHVFFKHKGFSSPLPGSPDQDYWHSADEFFQYFWMDPRGEISDVSPIGNPGPISDTNELMRFIPKFLGLEAHLRLENMRRLQARRRGVTSIHQEQIRQEKIAKNILERNLRITAEFGMDSVDRNAQGKADRQAIEMIVQEERAKTSPEIGVGDRVSHANFGVGFITARNGNKVRVSFADGPRTLLVGAVERIAAKEKTFDDVVKEKPILGEFLKDQVSRPPPKRIEGREVTSAVKALPNGGLIRPFKPIAPPKVVVKQPTVRTADEALNLLTGKSRWHETPDKEWNDQREDHKDVVKESLIPSQTKFDRD